MNFKDLSEIELTMMLVAIITITFLVQIIKTIIYSLKTKKFSVLVLFSTGRMPSSHSALVAGTCSVLFTANDYKISIPFIMVFVLAVIVIHDSLGIRLEASKHAVFLNDINEKYHFILNESKEPIIFKEKLGHKPMEVLVGILIGAIATPFLWLVLIL